MGRIQQLDAEVVNKIAAGEVVERPANVVKELLENSVDALATRIEVEVAQGGIELIRVVDNGEGILPEDLPLAVAPHATSKIRSADDLFRVQTMGFRGEALASIAQVSRFRLRSRAEGHDTGYELRVEFGRVGPLQPCGAPRGTLVEVRQLFANTPVRRKFLRTTATEFGHVAEQFTRVALSHPRLHLVLKHNEKTVYELPPADRLLDRLELFFGRQLAEQLIWVESESGPVRMWGYVGHPTVTKASRKNQYFFLNGRWIQDRSLQHALTEAYRGLLMVGRQPVAFLFIEMPPELVDVNVHPTKAEVRFREGQAVYRQLLSMLRSKFLSLDLRPELRLPAAGGTSGAPTAAGSAVEARLRFDRWPGPSRGTGELRAHGAAPVGAPVSAKGTASPTRARPTPASAEEATQRPDRTDQPPAEPLDRAAPQPAAGGTVGPSEPVEESSSPVDSHTAHVETSPDQTDTGPAAPPAERDAAGPAASWSEPPVRAMQVLDRYILLETNEGVVVIDQHALHERVLYEQLKQRVLSGRLESQRLLVPRAVELSPAEAAALLANAELLDELGFEIEEFGTNTVLLRRYPTILQKANLEEVLRDVADRLAGGGPAPTRQDLLDELLHSMACKAAIKAGQRLSDEEIRQLLAQRHLVENSHHCPHGRPTALLLSQAELDRQFGRLG